MSAGRSLPWEELTRRRLVEAGGAALAAAYALGGGRTARAAEHQLTHLPGLSAPAEILVDRWGIPHIYAATSRDAFLLQGFNAARDRLWQIDLWRRRGLGRLSAAFGRTYVAQDRAARLFLYRGDMDAEWAAYGAERRRSPTAFAAGVNAYVASRARAAPLPPEFEALGYRPDRWRPRTSCASAATGSSPISEQVAARSCCAIRPRGRALRKRLEPQWRHQVPDGLDLADIPDDVLDVYELATAPVDFAEQAGSASRRPRVRQGSNNWAIAGRRTATGRPILASDPHRAHGVPSLRYLAHLSRRAST